MLKYSYLLIIILGAVVFFQTLKYNYTNLDDKDLLADDKEFVSNISNVGKAFHLDVFKEHGATFYRPLFVVSLIVDASIGKMSLTVFHFTNILLHLIAVCLFFRFSHD